ncbi:hypothetical protein Tdes44962_MAKER06144 [Teratosphaeria destructans]|uniref:Uncharacterized protein n=1 Tax=Teratosphaeria destructans TaxID=418781 RepID=A0A9W7VY87_9PEZI|nr:hypothetical protein Tdes44962_MAKER06144 [Teratosphaeria destructans]
MQLIRIQPRRLRPDIPPRPRRTQQIRDRRVEESPPLRAGGDDAEVLVRVEQLQAGRDGGLEDAGDEGVAQATGAEAGAEVRDQGVWGVAADEEGVVGGEEGFQGWETGVGREGCVGFVVD